MAGAWDLAADDQAGRWAERVRASGIDGRTPARRITWLLPRLPTKADAAAWEDARRRRDAECSDADRFILILKRIDAAEGGRPEPPGE